MKCKYCGCTDERACVGGCYWIAPEVCSNCEDVHKLNKSEEKQMAYQEINPVDWKYENDGDFIEGVLVRIQENVGANKSMLYSIETQEGVKSVWGATILDSRMALVKVGEKIKITYKGKAEAKSGKNPAKIFKVEVDKD